MKKKDVFVFIIMVVMPFFAGIASAESVTQAITAENTFTTAIAPANEDYNKDKGRSDLGFLNLSVSGSSWTATVTLQRSFDSGSTWLDVDTFAENTEKFLVDYEPGVLYRIGVATGGYTSGTVTVRLSR